jgi:hypothetical protein
MASPSGHSRGATSSCPRCLQTPFAFHIRRRSRLGLNCPKTGLCSWSGWRDSNPRPLRPEDHGHSLRRRAVTLDAISRRMSRTGLTRPRHGRCATSQRVSLAVPLAGGHQSAPHCADGVGGNCARRLQRRAQICPLAASSRERACYGGRAVAGRWPLRRRCRSPSTCGSTCDMRLGRSADMCGPSTHWGIVGQARRGLGRWAGLRAGRAACECTGGVDRGRCG